MLVLITMAVATNRVQSGAVFAGLRTYYRYVPAFLLPIVYRSSDQQIRGQLTFIPSLTLLQLPMALLPN